MKDDDEDKYFQRIKLDEIKEESKKEIDKINESRITKEWNIDNNDMIVKLKDYIEHVGKELKIKQIILKKLKVSDQRIDKITSKYLCWLEEKVLFILDFFTFSIIFLIFFQFFFLQICYDIIFFILSFYIFFFFR